MIKCLLANNDSVVDKFLSESVLELEYLEQKVLRPVTIISLSNLSLYLSIIDNFPGRSSQTLTADWSLGCFGS